MTPTEKSDLIGQNDDRLARALQNAWDGDLDELSRASAFWRQEALFANKRANAIAARMDEIRGS
jgi:hypothetical protein